MQAAFVDHMIDSLNSVVDDVDARKALTSVEQVMQEVSQPSTVSAQARTNRCVEQV
jgi:hypothetical protein